MNVPYSALYDDIYYSREGGLEESKYVFLKGNNLLERWENHNCHCFTILELGFGTGLNFLATWKLWKEFLKSNPNHKLKRLFYISCEKYPLDKETIKHYLSEFIEIQDILKIYLEKYTLPVPNPPPGYYRYHFPEYGITLQLLIGEAYLNIQELEAKIDAFYLDGFNPKKNPDLWTKELFIELIKRANPEATLATYSSAKIVQENLIHAGFEPWKTKGFGKKREMLQAKVKLSNPKIENNTIQDTQPYCIVGAGIAGASVAYALSLRKKEVFIFDGAGIANGASGNPAGIYYPYLTKYPLPFSRFSLQAFLYGLDFILQENQNVSIIYSKGLDLLLLTPETIDKYINSLKEFHIPEHIAEFKTNPNRIFFPFGLTLSPKNLVHALIQKSKATFIQENFLLDNIYNKNIIFCNSYSAIHLPSFKNITLRKTRGQIAIFPGDILENPPNHAICSQSYLAPWINGYFIAGSTYDEFQTERGYSIEDENKIFHDMLQLSPVKNYKNFLHWKEHRQNQILQSILTFQENPMEGKFFRVSHRAQSKDRVPIVGKIPEGWVLTGLGSRGLVSGLLAGEMIASFIFEEPSPVPKSVRLGLSLERFLKNPSNSLHGS